MLHSLERHFLQKVVQYLLYNKKRHIFKQAFASSMESTVGSCHTYNNAAHFANKNLHFLRYNTCFNECVSKMALFPKPCCGNSRIDSILQNSMLHFPTGLLCLLKSSSTYIGGFSLKLGSNATHLWKNASTFAKGCGIHGGMAFFMHSHFTSNLCIFWIPLFSIENILHKLMPV